MSMDNLTFDEPGRPVNILTIEDQVLKQSESLFQEVYEQLPVPVIVFRQLDGLIIDINNRFQKAMGYNRDIVGKLLFNLNLIAPADIDEISAILKEKGCVEDFETSLFAISGKKIEVVLSIETVHFNNEKCYLATFSKITSTDIDERIKAEKALKHSQQLMQYVIEHNRSSLAVHDRDLKYIYVSQRYLQEYNVQEKNIIGKHHYDVFPDLPQKWRDVHQRSLAGEIISADDDPYIKADGTVEWTRWECRPWYEADETIGGIIVYTEVITERKKIDDEIKQRREELETFFDCAVDLLCIANTDGYFLRLNKEWENVLGYSISELENTKFIDLIHPDDHEATQNSMKDLFNQITINNFTNRYRCKNVDYKWIEWKSYPKGNIVYAAARDITDRKLFQEALIQKNAELAASEEKIRATNEELVAIAKALQDSYIELKTAKEKAEESDRLKTAFLANMSHEIRTPMNAIVGFSDFLTKPDITDERKERFSKIIKERTYDLLRIVEDILDVSKIEVGQLKFVETEFCLSSLMNSMFLEYDQKIKDSDSKSVLKLELSLSSEVENLLIRNDSQRLRQVISNLLENAIKFTHSGSIEFGCKKDDHQLIFFVRDTGIGIPENKREIIFDRFRQAEEAISARTYGGAGLGLAIVKGILNMMNGKIWFTSKVNEGSTFYFTIPITKKPDQSIQSEIVELSRRSKTVLVVEDNESGREHFEGLLNTIGLNCLYACNGEQALRLFRVNSTIALAFIVLHLPDMNGIELIRLMKKENPSLIIIALTNNASTGDMEACIDAGCSDYITKPINSSELVTITQQFL